MTPQELIDELYDAVENDDMYSRSYLVYAVEDLCADNDKLRELVRDFYPFASGRAANPWLSVRLERMRELGV